MCDCERCVDDADPRTGRTSTSISVFGWVGSALIVLAYLSLTEGWLVQGPMYHALNLIGATGVGVVCLYERTWQPLVIQVFWAGVAVSALARF